LRRPNSSFMSSAEFSKSNMTSTTTINNFAIRPPENKLHNLS
jgi:hypothetical protein